MTSVMNDAFRRWRTSPTLFVFLVLGFGAGIALNTAVFSLINALFLRSQIYRDPSHLVAIGQRNTRLVKRSVSWETHRSLRRFDRIFSDVAAFREDHFQVTVDGRNPRQIPGARVTGNIFALLGVEPIAGLTTLNDDSWAMQDRPVIIGHELWASWFGADPDLIGRRLTVDGDTYRVLAVMPRRFGVSQFDRLWLPLREGHGTRPNDDLLVRTVARLLDDTSMNAARSRLSAAAGRFDAAAPKDGSSWRLTIWSVADERTINAGPIPWLLQGVVGIVFLVACTNAVSLLLAQGVKRQREFAVRMALGATRLQIGRQVLAEVGTLIAVSATIGVLVSIWLSRLLLSTLPLGITPYWLVPGTDWRVILFTVLLAAFTSAWVGLLPALHITRGHLSQRLRDAVPLATAGAKAARWRFVLVVVQVALSVVLIAATGLLAKNYFTLREAESGFEPQRVLTLLVSLSERDYPTPEVQDVFYRSLLEDIRALDGVAYAAEKGARLDPSVFGTNGFVMEGSAERDSDVYVGASDRPVSDLSWLNAVKVVDPEYFAVLGIPFRSGRGFGLDEPRNSELVAVVNDTTARMLWGESDPVGKQLGLGASGSHTVTVIGVVGDLQIPALGRSGVSRNATPIIYLSSLQVGKGALTREVFVRPTTGDPLRLAESVRNVIRELDRNAMIQRLGRMDDVAFPIFRILSWVTSVFFLFAGIALVLAAAGLYALIAYSVTLRNRELGILMALGAGRATILRLVVRQGMTLALIGAVLGTLGSLWVVRTLSWFLADIEPVDIGVLGVSIAAVLGVSALATYFPARQATRADPVIVLRSE